MMTTTLDKLQAARESAEAHKDATGHDHIDVVQVRRFPVAVIITCHHCGQPIARVD